MEVAPVLLSAALQVLAWTTRVRLVGFPPLSEAWSRGEQMILAFWHNRMVMMPLQYRGRRVCVLNSQHRDGEIATRALSRWGIRAVRGSATRGGVGAFLRLLEAYREGWDVAVVPDGPRGPRYRAKPGVVHLAKATGATIYPVSYAARWKAVMRSWDGLIVPLPFSRIVLVVAEPLVVPRDTRDDSVEELRRELERRLDRATADAEAAIAAGG